MTHMRMGQFFLVAAQIPSFPFDSRPSLLPVRARLRDLPPRAVAWTRSASDSLARVHSLSRCSAGPAGQPLLHAPDSCATGGWAPYA
jgi:hypothetical protein